MNSLGLKETDGNAVSPVKRTVRSANGEIHFNPRYVEALEEVAEAARQFSAISILSDRERAVRAKLRLGELLKRVSNDAEGQQ